jgi:hypothetical protein
MQLGIYWGGFRHGVIPFLLLDAAYRLLVKEWGNDAPYSVPFTSHRPPDRLPSIIGQQVLPIGSMAISASRSQKNDIWLVRNRQAEAIFSRQF